MPHRRLCSRSRGRVTSDDNLTQANELYWHFVAVNPGRVVLLCDRACVLARSDRLDAMIELAY
jgi:hypothetical protein